MSYGDQVGEWVFSDEGISLAGLKEFAAKHGGEWTDVSIQTRFVLERERPWVEAIAEAQATWLPIFKHVYAIVLEHEREEIVESIPWAD